MDGTHTPDEIDRREPVVKWSRENPPAGRLPAVDYATGAGGRPFAYVREEVLTTGGEEALASSMQRNSRVEVRAQVGRFTRLGNVDNPPVEVAELRRRGFTAQLNHVYFAHDVDPNPVFPTPVFPTPVFPTPVFPTPVFPTPAGGEGCGCGCGCCCGTPTTSCPPHPSNPCGIPAGHHACTQATPVFPTPVFPTPVFPTPVFPTPVFPTPVFPTSPLRSSARPAPAGTPTGTIKVSLAAKVPANGARVIVLDTGLAAEGFRPNALNTKLVSASLATDVDRPDEDADGQLDPVAGHGTFIAGVIDQVAPGCEVVLHRVISTFAWCPEDFIIDTMLSLLDLDGLDRTVLSLSFGGTTLDYPAAMASAVADLQARGVVVVASAGNDATCVPTFPAAFPGVVSVGAVGPTGPAPFTNYGPWVRACAPGVDVLSTFFQPFEGSEVAQAGAGDPDSFNGWALWSGTSFSAPVVAGALARAIIAEGCTAKEAVERVIDAPALMRIPNLGTVVNVI